VEKFRERNVKKGLDKTFASEAISGTAQRHKQM